MNLQDLCERIVCDAIPATDSGATCFVPRYQIDQLREALSAPQPPAEAQAQGGGEVVAWLEAEPGTQVTELHNPDWPVGIVRSTIVHIGVRAPAKRQPHNVLFPLYTAPPSAPVGVEG